MNNSKIQVVWAMLRLSMGWIFLWPFFDKLYGLGFATESGKGWLDGASPTLGFLKFGTQGPFAGLYQSMAGSMVVDLLFMVGLLMIGLALILGIGVRIACISGILLLVAMWTAVLLPEHNPFLDDHLIYSIVLLGLIYANAGDYFGLGRWWSSRSLVQKHSWLR